MPSKDRFYIVLMDSKNAMSSEISKNLLNLNPFNDYIIWKKPDQIELESNKPFYVNRKKLKVVSYIYLKKHAQYFITKDTLQKLKLRDYSTHFELNDVTFHLNEEDFQQIKNIDSLKWVKKVRKHSLREEKNVDWVTVAPEFNRFLRKFKKNHPEATNEDLTLRLNERLGLTPEDETQMGSKIVVESEISRSSLLKPSIDPEPFDSTAVPDTILGGLSNYISAGKYLNPSVFMKENLRTEKQFKQIQQISSFSTENNDYLK